MGKANKLCIYCGKKTNSYADICHNCYRKRALIRKMRAMITAKLEKNKPSADAELEDLRQDRESLRQFIKGEWVDTDKIEKALNIDFGTGLKSFGFSRTAEWNPAPLNGQKITTKFNIKKFPNGCGYCKQATEWGICDSFGVADKPHEIYFCPWCGKELGE